MYCRDRCVPSSLNQSWILIRRSLRSRDFQLLIYAPGIMHKLRVAPLPPAGSDTSSDRTGLSALVLRSLLGIQDSPLAGDDNGDLEGVEQPADESGGLKDSGAGHINGVEGSSDSSITPADEGLLDAKNSPLGSLGGL
jgi:hypothetical protein